MSRLNRAVCGYFTLGGRPALQDACIAPTDLTHSGMNKRRGRLCGIQPSARVGGLIPQGSAV
jgi:hypothetical protein